MPRRLSTYLKVAACGLLAAIAFLTYRAGLSIWHARAALRSATQEARSAGQIPFTLLPLNDRAGASFERPYHAANYRAGASFLGDLYVSGGSTLTRFSADGRPLQTWFAGAQLPPFPLNGVAVRSGIEPSELWIATEGGGIVIYDGHNLRQLLPASQPLRKITALLPLSGGRMLVGTRAAGVFITDTRQSSLLHPQFATAEVTALAGDADRLWIGTRRNGLWLWQGGVATHFFSELPDAAILSLEAAADKAWAGTPLGVAEFSGGAFRRTVAQGAFAQSLAVQGSTLYAGTLDEGIAQIPVEMHAPTHDARRTVGSPMLSADDVVSFAHFGNDLLALSPQTVSNVSSGGTIIQPDARELASDYITAIHIDGRGQLWLGYFDRGLDVIGQGSKVHQESDVLFCINRIKGDSRKQSVAVATANGLVLFDESATPRQTLTAKSGLISNHVTDILFRENAEGLDSLIAATPAGLSFVDGKGTSSISVFQGLTNNHAYTLAESNGVLLAGTLGGFSLLRGGLVEASYNTANSGLRQNWITASATAGADIYLGTYGSGVVRLEPQHNITGFHEFSRGRTEINPNALLTTARAIYAGTAGRGLAILRRGEERWQFIHHGLPSENVTALDSREGELYIGTDNGLVRVREDRLTP